MGYQSTDDLHYADLYVYIKTGLRWSYIAFATKTYTGSERKKEKGKITKIIPNILRQNKKSPANYVHTFEHLYTCLDLLALQRLKHKI